MFVVGFRTTKTAKCKNSVNGLMDQWQQNLALLIWTNRGIAVSWFDFFWRNSNGWKFDCSTTLGNKFLSSLLCCNWQYYFHQWTQSLSTSALQVIWKCCDWKINTDLSRNLHNLFACAQVLLLLAFNGTSARCYFHRISYLIYIRRKNCSKFLKVWHLFFRFCWLDWKLMEKCIYKNKILIGINNFERHNIYTSTHLWIDFVHTLSTFSVIPFLVTPLSQVNQFNRDAVINVIISIVWFKFLNKSLHAGILSKKPRNLPEVKIKGQIIVIRNGKIVWKHGPYCWYFRLNLKYFGWPYRAYIRTAKNGDFC